MVTSKIISFIKETYWKAWYGYVSRADKNNELTFMNYGYDNGNPISLDQKDEKNRYQVQLYDKVAKSIALSLKEKDILEVGCGRGGGSSFIMRYFNPKSYTGIDLCKAAIDFCEKSNKDPRISFSVGDAMEIPFENQRFSAVINVESSHRYPNMPKFLSEAYRVLRGGGYFSFVDFRATEKLGELENQMRNSGMLIVEKEDITQGILRSLELDNQRKLNLIKRMVPRILHKPAKEFASLIGSESHKTLSNGHRTYVRYLLKKED